MKKVKAILEANYKWIRQCYKYFSTLKNTTLFAIDKGPFMEFAAEFNITDEVFSEEFV